MPTTKTVYDLYAWVKAYGKQTGSHYWDVGSSKDIDYFCSLNQLRYFERIKAQLQAPLTDEQVDPYSFDSSMYKYSYTFCVPQEDLTKPQLRINVFFLSKMECDIWSLATDMMKSAVDSNKLFKDKMKDKIARCAFFESLRAAIKATGTLNPRVEE